MIVDLIGINSDVDHNPDTFVLKKYPHQTVCTYSAYVHDYPFAENGPFPFTFSRQNLDFGVILPSNARNNQVLNPHANILVTTIKNNLDDEIKVKWYKGNKIQTLPTVSSSNLSFVDAENVFFIYPELAVIPPYETAYFETTFSPLQSDQFYFKTLTALVYWREQRLDRINQKTEIYIPLVTTLNFIGG